MTGSTVKNCIQCGRCCKHFSFFAHLNANDWDTLRDYIETTYGGLIYVKYLDASVQRFIARGFELGETHGWVCHPENNAFVQCPFFLFNPDTAMHYCEIHEIKPNVCKDFYCNGSSRYGREIEYCNPCWVEDIPEVELPENLRNGIPPCENGLGCKDFLHRIRFFIAHANYHNDDTLVSTRATKLLKILEKNKKQFVLELERMNISKDAITETLKEWDELDHQLRKFKLKNSSKNP